jgi:glycosyltransferase involved in cell wall biosynthesis
MRIAYLINQYPKVSHSFIRREILGWGLLTALRLRGRISSWCLRVMARCVPRSKRSSRTTTCRGRVRITGRISSERVREEILAARALVLPSFAEGLPVVIMEAMALRRPVISTFVAGIPELVQPGEHGWLVPAGDVNALAQAMQTCLYAPADTLVRMGEAAYKRVLARHNVDKEAVQLAKLFQIVVSQGWLDEGGVVSGVTNLESSGVEAPDWRSGHDKRYGSRA